MTSAPAGGASSLPPIASIFPLAIRTDRPESTCSPVMVISSTSRISRGTEAGLAAGSGGLGPAGDPAQEPESVASRARRGETIDITLRSHQAGGSRNPAIDLLSQYGNVCSSIV